MIFAAMTLNVMPLPPILQQGYAGGSTAGADISFVYKDRLHALPGPPPMTAASQDSSVLKRGIVDKKAVFQAPKRMSGS